jgi:hypothetical protein
MLRYLAPSHLGEGPPQMGLEASVSDATQSPAAEASLFLEGKTGS